MVVRPTRPSCQCPDCGAVSDGVHSRYVRKLSDLPASGLRVRLLVEARRFRCYAPASPRRIFAMRFDLESPWSRRTERLNILVHQMGLALSGRPAAQFSDRLMAPVTRDMLLCHLRRRGSASLQPLRAIGTDDLLESRLIGAI
ncbi:MAG: transposase family protein [Parvularculaceae bacterium]